MTFTYKDASKDMTIAKKNVSKDDINLLNANTLAYRQNNACTDVQDILSITTYKLYPEMSKTKFTQILLYYRHLLFLPSLE